MLQMFSERSASDINTTIYTTRIVLRLRQKRIKQSLLVILLSVMEHSLMLIYIARLLK